MPRRRYSHGCFAGPSTRWRCSGSSCGTSCTGSIAVTGSSRGRRASMLAGSAATGGTISADYLKWHRLKSPLFFIYGTSVICLLDMSLLCSFRSNRVSSLNTLWCVHSLISTTLYLLRRCLPGSSLFSFTATANLSSFLASAWQKPAFELRVTILILQIRPTLLSAPFKHLLYGQSSVEKRRSLQCHAGPPT